VRLTDGRRAVAGELLVGLSPGDAARQSALAELARRGAVLAGEVPDLALLLVRLPAGADVEREAPRYSGIPGVRYAEPNEVGEGGGGAGAAPNDSFYSFQWHHENTGQSGGTLDADVDASAGWAVEVGSPDVVLAVLDTGIDFAHPEFAGRLLGGFDFVNEDANPTADHSHGIYVTGIAAANADNAFGTAGVDRSCAILPVKVLGQFNTGTTFDLVQGLDYSRQQGADVVNLSLIGFTGTASLQAALANARHAGAILVACAGNGGVDTADASWPGASPDTISVGWTDHNDQRAVLSSTGSTVELVAPGVFLRTTATSHVDTFTTFSGCSAATPVVAGACSLLVARYPGLDVECARALLFAGAEDQVGLPAEDVSGWDAFHGHGRLNLAASLASTASCSSVSFLVGAPAFIDLDTGGAQTFALQAGAQRAGDLYWILGSATGTSPALQLGPYSLPLVLDAFTTLSVQHANTSLYPGSVGFLDGSASGNASFWLPGGLDPGLAGVRLHHAYVLVDLVQSFATTGASNAVSVELRQPLSLLAEDFEAGAQGWLFDNLIDGQWHVALPRECGASTHMAAYNRGPAFCDYALGIFSLGNLISPPFAFAGEPPFTVSFAHLRELDALGNDLTQVTLEEVGGPLAALLGNQFGNTAGIESVVLTVPTPELWSGKSARLRFTLTAALGGNDTAGWLVDDVEVTASAPRAP
jgi:thermitase